jgi:hypothetical protein
MSHFRILSYTCRPPDRGDDRGEGRSALFGNDPYEASRVDSLFDASPVCSRATRADVLAVSL